MNGLQGNGVEAGCLELHLADTPEGVAEALERKACELTHSQRATSFRLEERNSIKRLLPMRSHDDVPASIRLSQGIAGSVAREQVEYLCNAPSDDELFVAAVDGVREVRIHNLLSVPIATTDEVIGVVQVVNRLDRPYQNPDLRILRTLADHGAMALTRLRTAREGWEVLMSLASTVATMVDERYGTVGHVDRVRRMALSLGKDMDLSPQELRELELAALLHDIGRLGVSPDSLRTLIRDETNIGRQLQHALNRTLMQRLQLPDHLARLAAIALAPHRPDPQEDRSGDADPVAARVLSAADTFDLLSIGEHVDQQGNHMSYTETVEEVRKRSGKGLDPAVVNTLIENESFRMERRAHPRFESKTPMQLSILAPETEAKQQTATIRGLDMSQGGAHFWCDRELPASALLELRIVLPTGTVAAFARIARQTPDYEGKGYRVGVYFLGHREEE